MKEIEWKEKYQEYKKSGGEMSFSKYKKTISEFIRLSKDSKQQEKVRELLRW